MPFSIKSLAMPISLKKDYNSAIEAYKAGLKYFPDKKIITRGELAFNMAKRFIKSLATLKSIKIGW